MMSSLPSLGAMDPYPLLSLNHLAVPTDMSMSLQTLTGCRETLSEGAMRIRTREA